MTMALTSNRKVLISTFIIIPLLHQVAFSVASGGHSASKYGNLALKKKQHLSPSSSFRQQQQRGKTKITTADMAIGRTGIRHMEEEDEGDDEEYSSTSTGTPDITTVSSSGHDEDESTSTASSSGGYDSAESTVQVVEESTTNAAFDTSSAATAGADSTVDSTVAPNNNAHFEPTTTAAWEKTCNVKHPDRLGNGRCDGGDYNTYDCRFDDGDCIEYNDLYPNCHVENPFWIGDDECEGDEYNTPECGYDGGDCIEFNALYPNCTVRNPKMIGDGECDGGRYNTKGCMFDGGDCLRFNQDYSKCNVTHPSWVRDKRCYPFKSYNKEECGMDGGDCDHVDGEQMTAARRWEQSGVTDYEFVYEEEGEGRDLDFPIIVQVRDGWVEDIIFEDGEEFNPENYEKDFERMNMFLMILDLFAFLSDADELGIDVDVEFDETYGFPSKTSFSSADHGNMTATIRDFKPRLQPDQ